MKTIEQEAEEYALEQDSAYTNDYYGFIAGANSKHVQRQILQAQIDEIKNCISEFQDQTERESGIEIYSDAFNDFIANCTYRKQNLEQKLNEL